MSAPSSWLGSLRSLRQEFLEVAQSHPVLRHMIVQVLDPHELPPPGTGPDPPEGLATALRRLLPRHLASKAKRAVWMESWVLAQRCQWRPPSEWVILLRRPDDPELDHPVAHHDAYRCSREGVIDLARAAEHQCFGWGFLYRLAAEGKVGADASTKRGARSRAFLKARAEAQAFARLGERAWLILPDAVVEASAEPLRGPYPVLEDGPGRDDFRRPWPDGVRFSKTNTPRIQNERAAQWLGFIYRVARKLPGCHLDKDGLLETACEFPYGIGHRIEWFQADEEDQAGRFPGLLRRYRLTSLATDPFTTSVTVIDALLEREINLVPGAGPAPPNLFRWKGEVYALPPIPWRLLDYLWDKESLAVEDVAGHVWDSNGGGSDSALKSALHNLNNWLLKARVPWSYGVQKGYIVRKS